MTRKANNTLKLITLGILLAIVLMHIFLSKYTVFGKSESIFYADNLLNFATHFGIVFSYASALIFLYIFLLSNNKMKHLRLLVFTLFFMFLSFDEFIELHENTIHFAKNLFPEGSAAFKIAEYNWVVALSFFIAIIILIFVSEIRSESSPLIKKQYMAGLFFFFVVMITELISLQLFHKQPQYFISVTIEESSEMLGISMFFFAALDKLRLVTSKPS